MFSSLEGLPFQWSILPQNLEQASGGVLTLVPFKDSSIETTHTLLEMQEKGLETSKVVVQGVDTGRVEVRARLMDPDYKEVCFLFGLRKQSPQLLLQCPQHPL